MSVVNDGYDPLVLHWNGQRWSQQHVSGGTGAQLDGVSCASPTACEAVGGAESMSDGGGGGIVAARLTGHAWNVRYPSTGAAYDASLSSIACVSRRSCTAVGTIWSAYRSSGASLAERWNGRRWATKAAPTLGGSASALNGIACPSPERCLSSGVRSAIGGDEPLIEAGSGARWTVQPAVIPIGPTGGELRGIACASRSDCVAVGSVVVAVSEGSGFTHSLLIERWDGSAWSAQTTPTPPGAVDSQLDGVACPSPSRCMAVGYMTDASNDTLPVVLGWDGTRWSIQPTPQVQSLPVVYVRLNAVSCATATACTAVGQAVGTDLIETWDGNAWSVVSTGAPRGFTAAQLTGISCPLGGDCTAVGLGTQFQGGTTALIAARSTDGAWSFDAMPSFPAFHATALEAVSCTTTSDCTAVGSEHSSNDQSARPIAATWNGEAWTIGYPGMPAGTNDASLSGISCRPGRCVGVGYAAVSTSFGVRSRPFAVVESGGVWSLQTPPAAGTSPPAYFADGITPTLDAVACPDTSLCTAVGDDFLGDLPRRLAERGP